MKCIERFSGMLESQTETDWLSALIQLGEELGYERTLLALTPDRYTLQGGVFIRGNYPLPWRSIYDKAKLANIDPVVNHCLMRVTPLIWDTRMFASKLQKEMYEEACSYGIRAGISLPFHGAKGEFGIICFVNDARPDAAFQKEALHNIPTLSLLRDFAFEAAFKFAQPVFPDESSTVATLRELECLKWCAAGRKSWEIGKILRCSERTVNFHLTNVCHKLNTRTRYQAVVKALHMGLIKSVE